MRGGKATAAIFACLLFGATALAAAEPARGITVPPPAPAQSFGPATGIVLTRVYANAARDNEFVEIGNAGRVAASLAGWTLTDLEAVARFPDGTWLEPGGRIVVARNASSYAEDLLDRADFTWDTGDVPRLEGEPLRLADAGDEVLLLDPLDAVIDAYVYGGSTYIGPGWGGPPARTPGRGAFAVRAAPAGVLQDSDGAADWGGLRDPRIGQSELEPTKTVVPEGPATLVVSPGEARDALLAFLRSARRTLDVVVYTLTDEEIASVLAQVRRLGVPVRILLDGTPVGGLDEDAERIAGALVAAGVHVRWLAGGGDVVKRYRYLHAKYAIADGESAWIGSENFGPAGFPGAGMRGNRGWSVVVRDPAIAGALQRVFDVDFDPRRRDSHLAAPIPSAGLPPPPTGGWPELPSSRPLAARLVIGPDTALDPDGLIGILESARDHVWIEAFYIEETWRDDPNPFLETAFGVAARGIPVRVLLDGSWWNDAPETDGNDDVVERLNARAAREGANLEARLVPPYGRIERIHNKGVVVDGRIALVSSLNWAHASVTENREVGILLEDPALARILEEALWADWTRSDPDDGFRIDDPAGVALLYGVVATASAISLRILRGTGKGLKPGARMGRRGPRVPLRGRRGEVWVLSPHVVAEPEPRPRGGRRARGRGAEARGDRAGPEGD